MRTRDENKRKLLMQAAVRMFSQQPFNKVRLEDVAAAAGIGKGTLYIYFHDKEDLYYNSVYDGFADFAVRLEALAGSPQGTVRDRLGLMIRELADFSVRHPQLFQVMRTRGAPDASSAWDRKRLDIARSFTSVIRQGIAAGEFSDDLPEYTALYIMSMARAVMAYAKGPIDADQLYEHMRGVAFHGIHKPGAV